MASNLDETELARLVAKACRRPKPTTFDELRNAVPALVAEVRRLREEVKQGGIDYCALMDRHDAQFVRAEKLSGEVNWLAEVCATHCRDKSFDNAQCSIHDCAPIHCYHASAEQWKEAAREAVHADRE